MSFHKRPPADDLVAKLKKFRHVTAVARHYDASRNAVYEWISYYTEQGAIRHDCDWTLLDVQRPRLDAETEATTP